jgi:methylenetetrahydrofolate reductase (NADPH)
VDDVSTNDFELICEIEPPTRPDLERIRRQIEVMAPFADTFLAPDNHIGRATISSVAVAHEIQAAGAKGIACLNARDRNLLGLQRDLLTAAAYDVERFLFVYGDKPTIGDRGGSLTVRSMLDHVRSWEGPAFTVGMTASTRTDLPRWKRQADFVFAQVDFDVRNAVAWRERQELDCPVYAGVMVLASERMARSLAATIPDIAIPPELIDRLATDKQAGVEAACEQIEALRASQAFDGVHLITGFRYRDVAARLTSP